MKRALFVGLTDYPGNELEWCDNDAIAMKTIIERNGDGVTIIAASQSDEMSVESPEIHHGLFTDLILQGLSGGAADINGRITPAGLYSFVDQAL